MKHEITPGVLKRFRRTPWRFQETFQIPLRDLDTFVSIILTSGDPIQWARLTVDKVIFEPRKWKSLLSNFSPPDSLSHELSIEGSGEKEVRELLVAAFGDSLEFLFTPTPKPFVIYADHDEYATFFANTKANLNTVVHALLAKKYKLILDYRR